PRPLLDEQELPAREVLTGTVEQAGHLEREGHVAVEVLVQAVVPARLVAQQQRRGLGLAVLGADCQEVVELGRVAAPAAKRFLPGARDRRQAWIGLAPQLADDGRQR